VISKRAFSRLLAATFLATGAMFVAGIPSASAATGTALDINNACDANLIENDGTTGAFVPPGVPFPLPTTVARVDAPTEVDAGTSFDGVAGSVSIPIPELVDTKVEDIGIIEEDDRAHGVVPVWAAAHLQWTIQVDGAASIGTPSISGGNVIGASVKKLNATQIILDMPGSTASTGDNFLAPTQPTATRVPTEENSFPPNQSFTSPTLVIPTSAGAAGTTITYRIAPKVNHGLNRQEDPFHPGVAAWKQPYSGGLRVDSDVDITGSGAGHVFARAFCAPENPVLGVVQVVAPPPPGAPNAVADVATSEEGGPVTIDVLANDTENEELEMDVDSLAITSDPSHGSAVINDDKTVTYTPASGFTGTDSFTYKICSILPAATTTTTIELDVPKVAQAVVPPTPPCDTAIVTINVLAAQVVVDAPTPTTAAPATTVAAQAQLPVTGRSSVPQALAGLGLCVAGAAALAFGRSRRAAAQS
jgi:hypothetical protein